MTSKSPITGIFHQFRSFLVVGAIASTYYLLIPTIVTFSFPCLTAPKDQSFSLDQCNLSVVMDRSLLLGLLGVLIFSISGYLSTRHHQISFALILGSICAIFTVTTYYLYLPQALKLVDQTPIYTIP